MQQCTANPVQGRRFNQSSQRSSACDIQLSFTVTDGCQLSSQMISTCIIPDQKCLSPARLKGRRIQPG